MDLNKETQVKETKSDFSKEKEVIINAIKSNQTCYWPNIMATSIIMGVKTKPEHLLSASKQLQKEGVIRLKEDSCEHEMEYILINEST